MDINVKNALDYLDADDYTEWIAVGMALKSEGCDVSTWIDWSRKSSHFTEGMCERKWVTFSSDVKSGVTGGTIIHMAQENGFVPVSNAPVNGHAMSWEDVIDEDEHLQYDDPSVMDNAEQIKIYLKTLFNEKDIINYVFESYQQGDRWIPANKGFSDTRETLLARLEQYKDNEPIEYTFGDYKHEAGAWIRINPLDGEGIKNENVTDFRYVLIESDTIPKNEQQRIYIKYRLPIAAMVDSGGKSIHAIVRIEADNYEQYKERVKFLYDYLKEKGVMVDKANKNPARLSRIPGVFRGNGEQKLLAVNIGCKSWDEWYADVNNIDTELPEFDTLDIMDGEYVEPVLDPEMIEGILRTGRKMLVSGGSKAGKSVLLMELAVALATGRDWLGFKCMQGQVIYLNFEINKDVMKHRTIDILKKLEIPASEFEEIKDNLIIWNLRGKAVTLDKFVPILVKRIKDNNLKPLAIIVDPIYKVLMGDENSASDMGKFCNEFDKICNATGAAVVFCHHHSKGGQGQKKAIDRASGSGVFARDPDAIVDMLEIELTDDQQAEFGDEGLLPFRLEFTLREFKPLPHKDIWFEYPLHIPDFEKILKHNGTEGSREANLAKSPKRTTEKQRKDTLDSAFKHLSEFNTNRVVTVKDIVEFTGKTQKTIYNYLKEFEDEYQVNGGIVKQV